MWVGLFNSCWNPSEEVSTNNMVTYVVLMSFDYQEDDLTLKWPMIIGKYGLWFFISVKRFLMLDKDKSNTSLVWLGER